MVNLCLLGNIFDFFYNFKGFLIGFLLALILLLIIRTINKRKNNPIVALALIIICCACGFFGSVYYNNNILNAKPLNPEQKLEIVDNVVKDSWKLTNGGFTFEQIKSAKNDKECPVINDVIIDLTMQDFGDYVCFSYDTNYASKFYNIEFGRNVTFLKTTEGLILDGVLNVRGYYNGSYGFLFWNSWHLDSLVLAHNNSENNNALAIPNNIYFNNEFAKTEYSEFLPFYTEMSHNLFSLSSLDYRFLNENTKNYMNGTEAINHAISITTQYVSDNVVNQFNSFENVELINGSNKLKTFNSFYNYLYSNIKDKEYNSTKIINVSDLMCAPISEELQSNYPVSDEFKALYPDIDYYGVYNCDIGVNLHYIKGNSELNSNVHEDYVDIYKNKTGLYDDEKIVDDKVISDVDYSKLIISLNNKDNADLSNLDLKNYPVEIEFISRESGYKKTLKFNSVDDLNKIHSTLLINNETYDYKIFSSKVIFDNYSGYVTLNNEINLLTFNYTYYDNYVLAGVGLNPVGSIDNSLDLAINPVKVILSNTEKNLTYQFVFDSNEMLDEKVYMLIELGDYEYSILSSQLVFANVSGNLTITASDYIMLFNCAYDLNNTNSKISLSLSNVDRVGSSNNFKLSATSSTTSAIDDYLSAINSYNVYLMFYDINGVMVEQLSHNHSKNSSCSDNWLLNNLINGISYTVQLRFADKNDNTNTYLSSIIDFVFNSSKVYTLTYVID